MTEEIINDVDAEEIMDRTLATIEQVLKLEPIPGKDMIEFISILGYKGVVQKGLHKVGDLVLYVKEDSILPEIPMFEWMRSFKFRVKAKKFSTDAGPVYSQCIVIPFKEVLAYLMETAEIRTEFALDPLCEGYDLTKRLGITKYVPKANRQATSFGIMKSKGTFPTHIVSKTDETNAQSKPRVLEELLGLPYYITLKMDGSSMSAMIKDDEFIVCSRNNILAYEANNSFWEVAGKYKLKEVLEKNPNVIIQGELCGPKVQNNRIGLTENKFFVFNIVNAETREYMSAGDAFLFCNDNGLTFVPRLAFGESFNMTLDELIQLAISQTYRPSGNPAEGIVLRPQEFMFSNVLKDTLSLKIMNPEYK